MLRQKFGDFSEKPSPPALLPVGEG